MGLREKGKEAGGPKAGREEEQVRLALQPSLSLIFSSKRNRERELKKRKEATNKE